MHPLYSDIKPKTLCHSYRKQSFLAVNNLGQTIKYVFKVKQWKCWT